MPTSAQFTTVTTEGGLLPGDLISRLVNDTRSLPGTREEDYWITPGRQLREIINRSWNDMLGAWQVFQPHAARLSPDDHTAMLTWERWLLPLFAELGFGHLDRIPEAIDVDGKDYPVSHRHQQALIHLVGWNVLLDRRTPGVAGAAKAAPHSMVQELLNRTDEHIWAVISNGRQLRILRDNSGLTRAAYVEFDLEQMFSEGIFTDFVALWLLVHASRLEGDPQTECWLEKWATEARQQGVRALDTLGQGFEDAIKTLGQGFLAHPANNTLRERLRDGHLATQDYYRQLLRLVYRLVFLLVAEDRDLLHPPDVSPRAKERYARYYSLSRIRDMARRRRGTKHSDLWDQIAVVVKSLGPEGQPALGLPALNSGLWAIDGTADLNGARLANAYFLVAVRFIAYRQQDEALHRIDYRNLGSEELGSVYESLLELHPDVDQSAATFSLGHAAGNERKTSGSYYTPTSLISALLDSALEPVLDEAAAKPHPQDALLDLKVLDPACGSGHFLVAAAQRIARRLAVLRTGETDPTPDVFRHALRQVIGRCIFGVDLNPMAVELCKVSLWLESVEPGKPLSFLDHHIVCGNSLLGATPEFVESGIPDDAYRPLTGDERVIVTSQRRRNSAERSGQGELSLWGESPSNGALAQAMAEVDDLNDDDMASIAVKEVQWKSVLESETMARACFAADVWCAAFVLPKVAGSIEVTTSVIRRAMERGVEAVNPQVVDAVRNVKAEYRFLHFHTTFPQVFSCEPGSGTDGALSDGFDVVFGNPPWDKVQMREQEFFATSAPEIAAAAGAVRKRMVANLADSDPDLFAAYLIALHHGEAESAFLRNSGRFPLNGRGQINTYAVFAELMRSSIRPIGRCGAIVPLGIATDDTTKHFFRSITSSGSLVSIFGFENEAFIFPAIHHATKFCLLTLAGSVSSVERASFAFFCRGVDGLQDENRRFELSNEDISLLNPNTGTCAVFRSRRDAELTLAIYRRVPVLVSDGPSGSNPWNSSFRQGLFNMTSDSGLFRSASQCEADGASLFGNLYRHPDGREWLPLYEGKMVHHFDHRYGTYAGQSVAQANQGTLPTPGPVQHADSHFVVLPRYWVDAREVEERLDGNGSTWFLGFRDITSAVSERTVIAAIAPRAAFGNQMPLVLSGRKPQEKAILAACLSSHVLDYAARQKVGGTHLNFFIAEQLPVLPPEIYQMPTPWNQGRSLSEWLVSRVLELTYTAWDLEGYALDLGHPGPPFRWDEERRAEIRSELDAAFFHLYGVERREDVEYIMSTFPILQRREEVAYGEYRSARLILERYDAMARATEIGASCEETQNEAN